MQYLTTNQPVIRNPRCCRETRRKGVPFRCLPRSCLSWTTHHVFEKVHYYALLFSLYKSTTQKANKISQAKLWQSPSLLGNEYESGLWLFCTWMVNLESTAGYSYCKWCMSIYFDSKWEFDLGQFYDLDHELSLVWLFSLKICIIL